MPIRTCRSGHALRLRRQMSCPPAAGRPFTASRPKASFCQFSQGSRHRLRDLESSNASCAARSAAAPNACAKNVGLIALDQISGVQRLAVSRRTLANWPALTGAGTKPQPWQGRSTAACSQPAPPVLHWQAPLPLPGGDLVGANGAGRSHRQGPQLAN